MTQGSIVKNIILFSLPLLAGNLFQQLYNMVDTWVIGQTGDNGAYAAVGSIGPIVNIVLGIFVGFSSGAGVVISQYFGAKKYKEVHDAVHTTMLFTVILGAAFTILGELFTPVLLSLMFKGEDTGSPLYTAASTYLRIYFAGTMFIVLYNMGAGILRAVGDSQRPFYFLVVSTVSNTVLDLLFVNVFGMGVAGVALATIIAQFLSAVFAMYTIIKTDMCIKFRPKEMRIQAGLLGKIIKVGLPAAIQMGITAFSNVFVQSYIGGAREVLRAIDRQDYVVGRTVYLGAWTTYSKIDQFIFLPMQTLALAVTTFVAQNLGVGDEKRAKKGFRITYLMATAITAVLIVLVITFAKYMAAFFNRDAMIVEYSTLLLTYITPFYICCCINQTFSAALRGAGNATVPMIVMLCSFVGVRQIFLYIISHYTSNAFLNIAIGYPVGWICCAVTLLIYYKIVGFKNGKMT